MSDLRYCIVDRGPNHDNVSKRYYVEVFELKGGIFRKGCWKRVFETEYETAAKDYIKTLVTKSQYPKTTFYNENGKEVNHW